MTRKKYLPLVAGVIVGGLLVYSTLATVKVNKEYQDTMTIMDKEIQSLREDYDNFRAYQELKETRLNETIDGLNEELQNKETELEGLRNQLNEMTKKVSYDPNNATLVSGATTYHLQKALKDTELYDLAPAFVQAEQTYGVNAYVLASIVALESGWGKSTRANNGSNNLTGFAVYSRASRGEYFDSKEECIMRTAELLSRDYLSPDGIWHNGVSVDSINTKYSADQDWDAKVVSIANGFIDKSNS